MPSTPLTVVRFPTSDGKSGRVDQYTVSATRAVGAMFTSSTTGAGQLPAPGCREQRLDAGERAHHRSRIAGGDHENGVGLAADVRRDAVEHVAGVDYHQLGVKVLDGRVVRASARRRPPDFGRRASRVGRRRHPTPAGPAQIASLQVRRPARTSASVYRSSMPHISATSPPRESASTSSVRLPLSATAAASPSATVVVPTPPLPPATTTSAGRSLQRGDSARLQRVASRRRS